MTAISPISHLASSNIVRSTLNKKGQATIINVLDTEDKLFSDSFISAQKQNIIQRVKDAGNEWFSEFKLKQFLLKRHKEFRKTRSQARPNPILSSAGPLTTTEEEEKLFGQISEETRMHLRWLYQVLERKEHDTLAEWACQAEYAVTIQEFEAYFNYLKSSGVPVFQGLSEEARLKLQGLLRGHPDANRRKYKTWARKLGIDDTEAVYAYLRHLQDVMGIRPKENQSAKRRGVSTRKPSQLAAADAATTSTPNVQSNAITEPGINSEISRASNQVNSRRRNAPESQVFTPNVRTPQPAAPTAAPPPIPILQPSAIAEPVVVSRASNDPAHDGESRRIDASEHRISTPNPPASKYVEQKPDQPASSKEIPQVSRGIKRKRSAQSEDSFRLFGNHPLRTQGNPGHDIRIARVHTKRKTRRTHTSVSNIPTPLRILGATPRNGATIADNSNAVPESDLTHDDQSQVAPINSVQQENAVEALHTQATELQSPGTPPQAQENQEDGPLVPMETTDNNSAETPPIATIEPGEIIEDDEEDDELKYPESESELEEGQIDELDTEDEPISPSVEAPVSVSRVDVHEALDTGKFVRSGLDVRAVEELKRWIDKNEHPIAELKRYRDGIWRN